MKFCVGFVVSQPVSKMHGSINWNSNVILGTKTGQMGWQGTNEGFFVKEISHCGAMQMYFSSLLSLCRHHLRYFWFVASFVQKMYVRLVCRSELFRDPDAYVLPTGDRRWCDRHACCLEQLFQLHRADTREGWSWAFITIYALMLFNHYVIRKACLSNEELW